MRKCNRCGKVYPRKHKLGPCRNIVSWFTTCEAGHVKIAFVLDKPEFCNKKDCHGKIVSWSPIKCTGFILKT